MAGHPVLPGFQLICCPPSYDIYESLWVENSVYVLLSGTGSPSSRNRKSLVPEPEVPRPISTLRNNSMRTILFNIPDSS